MTVAMPTNESSTGRSVLHRVADTVVAHDVEVVFGVMGLANMQLVVHLNAVLDVAYCSARHESGAISMADGYARATGKPGVCTVTAGPGLSNSLTSLLEAQRSATPLVLLAGASAVGDLADNQYLEQERLLRSVGIGVEGYDSAADIPAAVDRALSRAIAERQPIVVNLPFDLQQVVVARYEARPAKLGEPVHVPAHESILKLVDLLSESRNPLLLAGRGAIVSGARGVLEELADRVGAHLLTSAPAKGFFSGNPNAIGVSGGFSTRRTLELVDQADTVIVFGASLNPWQMRHGKLLPSTAPLIQVDINPAAIGRYTQVDLGIVGDASAVASATLKELAGRGIRRAARRTDARPEALSAPQSAGEWSDASNDQRIDPRTLAARLDDLLPAARTIASGDGLCFGWSIQGLTVPDERGWLMMLGYQSLGHALGAAIGAAVGRSDRLAVATVGDGGLMMALSELETAVRIGRPLVVVVFNDSAYGAEIFHLKHHFTGLPDDLVRFPDVDFAATARGLGCTAITVRRESDLEPLKRWLQAPAGTFVIDAKVVPEVWADWMFS